MATHDEPQLPSVDVSDFNGVIQVVLMVAAPTPATTFGKLPVEIDGCRCLVSVSKPPSLTHEESGLDWPLESRDWCIEAVFSSIDVDETMLDSHASAVELLDRTLAAWNHASAWMKAKDRATSEYRLAPWLPRLGRIHVRAAVTWDARGQVAGFVNPNNGSMLMAMGFLPFGEMFVTNGPAAMPLPGITEQLQEGLDLLNHGFTREAFLATFTTFESLLRQNLSDALRISKGEALAPDRRVLKKVRDSSLRRCLTDLSSSAEVGWTPLDGYDQSLFAELLDVATGRNQVLHHGARIMRPDVEASLEIVWQATAWLLAQTGLDPNRYLPSANVAAPRFWLWKPGDPPVYEKRATPA